jgi:radical SAM superfamily enzyme YgiQ (UPF0313 family)
MDRRSILEKEIALDAFSRPDRDAIDCVAGYPAAYRIGMANLGFHFLYRGLRRSRKLRVERVFSDTSPVTLETGSRLGSRPILLFSISYEEDYLNLVRMLREAGVSALRAKRGGRPLLIVGGPAASANPAPLAPIVDAVALGEGEGTIDGITGVLEESGSGDPSLVLEGLARVPGMFVPGYSRGGVRFNEPVAISRFPRSSIITAESSFPGTLLVESGRGCPGACSFCLATTLYRPFRFMPLGAFEELLGELPVPIARIGLVSTAVAANPDFVPIVRLLAAKGVGVSFSSLRAEDLDEEKARLIGKIGTASVSLAPESGSERLRYALGKRVADEVYFDAGRRLRSAGVTRFTLYLLFGAPGERGVHISETAAFLERFRHAIGDRHFSVHVNPLVPKAWTPLEFFGMSEAHELARRQRELEKSLRGLGIRVQIKSIRSSIRQGLFSMGDEAVGLAIVHHVEEGLSWKQALRKAGVNERAPHERRGPETSFPWDGISGPARRGPLYTRFETIERESAAEAS